MLTFYDVFPCLIKFGTRLAREGVGTVNVAPETLLLVANCGRGGC